MNDMGDKIRQLRITRKMTLEELGNAVGVGKSTVRKWENGIIANMRRDKIAKIAAALHVSPAFLMGWEEDDPVSRLVSDGQLHPVKSVRLPIIGSVSCGEPKFAAEDHEGLLDAEEDVDADFCLRAKGDSMINAGIEDGNIVFIKRQQTVQNGEIAVVAIGDEALLKRVYWYPDKQLLILRPENPAYEDLLYSAEAAEEIRILGRAIMLQKMVR